MSEVNPQFSQIKERLDEIVQTVSAEDISLDDALNLYEEAVSLGMQVSSVLEENIAEEEIAAEMEAVQPADEAQAEPVKTAAEEQSSETVETAEAPQEPQTEEEHHG